MRATFLLIAAAAAALAGCAGSSNTSSPTTTSAAATTSAVATTTPDTSSPAPEERLLAATSDPAGSVIHRVDRRTLEPLDGRGVKVPFYSAAAERSPNGKLLAVGESEGGKVLFVDVDHMQALGTAEVDSASYVDRLHWVKTDLLLASLGGTPGMVAALDPSTNEVLSVHDLGGATLYSQPAGKELVSLVAPTSQIGPARLVAFDGSELREVTLTEVPAGWEEMEGTDDSDYRARQSVPALAVNPEGTRAVVIPGGGRVAEVDLDTMEVRYHDLAEPVSFWGRLRDWLEPSAQAKAINGPDRNAVWLPNGLVAVSGAEYTMDGDRFDVTPAGLSLIDSSNWSVRRLSDEPGWVTFRGGALLASVWYEDSAEQKLMVFDIDGGHRFTLVRVASDLSQTSGSRLYATTNDGRRFEIIDLESGKTVGRAEPSRQTWLLNLD
jgi:hypothetical protein